MGQPVDLARLVPADSLARIVADDRAANPAGEVPDQGGLAARTFFAFTETVQSTGSRTANRAHQRVFLTNRVKILFRGHGDDRDGDFSESN